MTGVRRRPLRRWRLVVVAIGQVALSPLGRRLRVRAVHSGEEEHGHRGRWRRLLLLGPLLLEAPLLQDALLVLLKQLVEQDEVVVLRGVWCGVAKARSLNEWTTDKPTRRIHPSAHANTQQSIPAA